MRYFLTLLRKRDFWPLFGSMSLGALNDNFMRQALIALLAFGAFSYTTQEKTILSSLATGLMILPFFLFSSLAGELADRYRKSTLFKISKAFELLCAVLAAVFFYFDLFYPLLLSLFLMGAQSAFFGPIKYGALPEIFPPKDLVGANGLVEGATFVAIVLGTVLGSFLVTLRLGPQLFVPAGLVAFSGAGLIFALKQPASTNRDPSLKISKNLFASTLGILRAAKARESVFLAILAISWFWGMGSVLLAQIPVLVSGTVGGSPLVSTLLVTMFALGVAFGSVLVQFFLKGEVSAKLVPASSALLTALLFLFALSVARLPLAPDKSVGVAVFFTSWVYLRIAVLAFLISVVAGFFVVPLNALLQHLAPEKERSRIVAANNIVNALFMVAAALLTLTMTALGASLGLVFLALSFSALVVTVATLLFLPDEAIKQFARFIILVFYRPRVKGLERLQEFADRAVLVTPNHVSFLDVALIVCYFPRKVAFAIDKNWAERWWVRPLLRFFEAIPINPANPLATRDIIAALKEGRMVVIFPEGRITTTGSLMKVYEGPGVIAARAGAPILPVVINGAEYSVFGRARENLRRFPQSFQVEMEIFAPITLDYRLREGEKRKEARARLAGEIYEVMAQCRFLTRDYRLNLYRALEREAERSGGGRAIIEDQNRAPLAYGGFLRRVKILGRVLTQSLAGETRAGVLLPNSVALCALAFALWAAGKIPVVLNYSQGKKALRTALAASRARTVITSRAFLAAAGLEERVAELETRTLFLEDLKIDWKAKLLGLFWEPKPSDPAEPAAALFTSGSEGYPKGAMFSHENLLANILQARCLIDINEDDLLFNAMPAFHAFGLNIGIVLPLVSGIRSFVYPSPLHVKAIPELIYDSKATVVLGSDTFAGAWAQNAHPYDFFRVKYFILGAEKVKEKTLELYYRKMNLKLWEGYGVTEASPIVAVNSKVRSRDGSVGQFLPGIRYKILPVPGVAKGGRLLIKGPNVMMGYLLVDGDGEPVPPEGGWYDTGDIVEVDGDGFVWIKGRFKRFAKISGEMISLASVEEVAAKVWPQATQAALALPDERRGEKIILATTMESPRLSELRDALVRAGLTELSAPKTFVRLPRFPLTPMGKPDLPRLAAMVAEILAGAGESPSPAGDS
ncbi:MAG: MFS transporter [Deltaproteobacteria bacterium]|jgi:acyl-[acyl-carrier-protein]-phospholipid O-acyltransferase/long-chain-fatty-acid--[acyl-carrier-protein] ligase|nr:MFS transporter [Deltaproteobacteria bacterium]